MTPASRLEKCLTTAHTEVATRSVRRFRGSLDEGLLHQASSSRAWSSGCSPGNLLLGEQIPSPISHKRTSTTWEEPRAGTGNCTEKDSPQEHHPFCLQVPDSFNSLWIAVPVLQETEAVGMPSTELLRAGTKVLVHLSS